MKRILLLTATIFSAFVIANAQENMALQITEDGTWFECTTFMDFTTTSVTFEAWVKLDAATTVDNYTAVVDGRYGGLSNSKALIFKTINNKLTLSYEWEGAWGFEDSEGLNEVQVDTWQHIAVVVDGTAKQTTFYVNGVAGATHTPTGTAADQYGNVGAEVHWDTLFIGNSNASANRTVIGLIDEVRVWNVARTESEIADNMGNEIDENTPGLLAYYQCNEDATSTTLTDVSGNGNDAANIGDKYAFVADGGWVIVSIDKTDIEKVSIFPNPVKDVLRFKGVDITNSEIKIYNVTGQLVNKTIANSPSLSVADLQAGLYFISINKGTNQFNSSFVKE